jgi:uncharacterized protein YmfQ (DUF2313 family)
MAAPQYLAADFLAQWQRLLPTGPIWPREADAVLTQCLAALTPTYERQAGRSVNLLADAFPVQPVELLPDWETTLGLPDPCLGAAPTLQARQQAVAARFVAGGGQSIAYYVNVAAALGYTVTVTTFRPLTFGQAFGLPMLGAPWASTWQVNLPSDPVIAANFGGAFGAPFATWGSGAALLCEIQRLAPAHTTVIYQGP